LRRCPVLPSPPLRIRPARTARAGGASWLDSPDDAAQLWAAGECAEAIVTAAADTPFFPGDLAARLVGTTAAEAVPLAMR
jgi:hypothetical protein